MVVDIVNDTAMAGGFGYLEGFTENAICSAMKSSSNQMLSGLVKTGIPGMVIDFGIKSYDSITNYAEGNIDELELMYDLGSNATTTVVAFEAAKLGASLGAGLGPVGSIAGGVVGGMVGYCIASEAYIAVIDAGAAGAEYIGEKAMEFGQNCIDLANEYLPEFASDITDSLNDFASNFSLPFSF